MNSLVSVIIPVYNVERYVRKCVESVCCQTYRNLEILLIDDGSTDRSGSICDALAETDSRIRVFHKENGGPSAARNFGIRAACGSYLAFADSDDFLMPDMIGKMLHGMQSQHAEIAACNYELVGENGKREVHKTLFHADRLLPRKTAIRCMLLERSFRFYPWNKLYRAELFQGIEYPEGVLFEDISTNYRLFCRANRIYYCNEPLYGYLQRAGSTTLRQNKTPEELKEMVRAMREILKKEHFRTEICIGSLLYYKYYFHDMIKIGAWDDTVCQEAKAIYRTCRKDLHRCRDISAKDKAELMLLNLNPALYVKCYRMYCTLKERICG